MIVFSISIRAPARGATVYPYTLKMYQTDFNPRSREGSDSLRSLTSQSSCHFNPRSREGSDVADPGFHHPDDLDFNPHSREGSDYVRQILEGKLTIISIRAPARGATVHSLPDHHGRDAISIRAPARGAT